MTFTSSVAAQSLPDEAGPSTGSNSSTPSQESITNPGGFGKATDQKTIDPSQTDSTGEIDCRQQKDVKTGRHAAATADRDCIR
jgi:hypothetical protein